MADTDRLFAELAASGEKPAGVTLSGLVLNEKGLERGLACGVGCSAWESPPVRLTAGRTRGWGSGRRRNGSLPWRVSRGGRDTGAGLRAVRLRCGYEGNVPQERVLGIVRRYCDAGLKNISLADTAGHAVPDQVERMFSAVAALDGDIEPACHFHNTYGLGLANAYAALKAGVGSFESSVAGLGGCPFTKIAGGTCARRTSSTCSGPWASGGMCIWTGLSRLRRRWRRSSGGSCPERSTEQGR